MSENFGIGPAELRKALGMYFAVGARIRVAVLTAMLISSAGTVARAEQIARLIPNDVKASEAIGPHSSALSLQNAQSSTQPAPDSHAPPPAVDSGHAGSTPIVAYEHGQLTITAENARLSDVLSALHEVMGAEIDLPAGSSDERIWARLGPGPARKILSDLLSNTDLNYVIQGSSRNVDGIQSVMLTPRTEDAPGKSGVSSEAAGRREDRRQSRANSGATEASEQEVPASQEPAVAAVAAEATPPSPGAVAADPQSVAANSQSPMANPFAHPSSPASLTQEQIVQQLTNMYQQRKQMQQNQVGSTPN